MSLLIKIVVVLGALAAALTAFVRLVFVREGARRRLFPIVRPLYKHVLNPYALRTAASGAAEWGVVHHVGRRSGVMHHTPIDAQRTADGSVVIPLVYGPGADWCRNILAAGRCTLTLNQQELTLREPRIVSIDLVTPRVPAAKARFWRSIGIERCILLAIAGGGSA